MSAKPSQSELRQAADQCVKCAVCLPHCPTYALSPEEAESPRGRITLLQGIVHERLDPTPDALRHLDSCLSCGRCEQVCPARVPYTRLLDGTRFFMTEHPTLTSSPPSLDRRLTARLLSSPVALRLLGAAARGARASGLHKLLGNSRAGRGLLWTSTEPSTRSREADADSPDAWLFTGCLTDAFEPDIAVSARRVARAFGVALRPTPPGLCCGALYQHQGNRARSEALTRRNIEAVSGDRAPIVPLLSGCGRGLVDGLSYSDDPSAGAVAGRVLDLFELLDSARAPASVEHSDRVGLYAPCSLNRSQSRAFIDVVHRVSSPDISVIGPGHGCCGAAGDHMLHEPERARRLAEPIVDDIVARELTHVLTPNIGCVWHLRANLAARRESIVVEHPAQWLARHLA